MKPTNHFVWYKSYEYKELLQWWADDEGYGEWREVEIKKFAYPEAPEGFKGKGEKPE